MATAYQPAPLDTLLAAIPSLPRPVLASLTARMIERLDEMDGDPDLEDSHDAEEIDEREPEQMGGDVPCPHVYAIEPDPETGKRAYLGRFGIEL